MADFKYEIVEHIGTLSESAKGWTKELNKISWNGGEPKYDIRDWAPEREKMGKGVTLSENEMVKLMSICHKGDVVVSQDYGVAAMALGKGAYAIHQSGKWYTNENIDQMLMERHLNKKARRSSHKIHMKGCTMSGGHRFCTDRSGNGDTRKRTEEDDVRFAQSFEKLILMAKSKEAAQSGTI